MRTRNAKIWRIARGLKAHLSPLTLLCYVTSVTATFVVVGLLVREYPDSKKTINGKKSQTVTVRAEKKLISSL